MKEEKTTDSSSGMSNVVYTALFLIRYALWGSLIVGVLGIASLNADPVVLNYFRGSTTLPLYLLLLCTFTMGCLIGIGFNLVSHIRLNIYNRRLEQQYRTAKSEVVRLKQDFRPEDNKDDLSSTFPPHNIRKARHKIADYYLG